jgi:iron complex outermembrane recepter protein
MNALTPLACAALLALSTHTFAQTAPTDTPAVPSAPEPSTPAATKPTPPAQPPAPTPAPAPKTQTVIVTGNPLRAQRPDAATSVLQGDALMLKRSETLAETLASTPSVAMSWFGPSANRPVIRGLDGDRVRMLSNSGASLDASSVSQDHAVPIDPLVVDRIEVLRGPAALLYGGSAVGGVVNTIDNRIPTARIDGLQGAAELRFGGASAERGGGAVIEGGQGPLAWHADVFGRRTSDLRVPAFDRPVASPEGSTTGSTTQRTTRLPNTAGRASGGALGVSLAGVNGHAGLSIDTYNNRYGSVADEGVTLDMKRQRAAFSAESRNPVTGIAALRVQAAATRYQHQELEADGAVGTTFTNRGSDARVELTHQPWALPVANAQLQGVVGVQAESSTFSAVGEEAFLPSTRTQHAAVFALEKLVLARTVELSAGLRLERANVRCNDGVIDTPACLEGVTQRRFAPRSGALGAQWSVTDAFTVSASLASTQRAPTSTELFANGVHVATAAFELGNPNQAIERSRNAEASLRWKSGEREAKLTVFDARFDNYISLAATGASFTNDEGDSFPVYAFRPVPARLRGVELEARTPLWHAGAHKLDVHAQLSTLRGTNRATQAPLPRLAPTRVTLGADYRYGPWSLQGEVQRAQAQSRVPDGESATPAYTLVNLAALWQWSPAPLDARIYVKLNNVGNTLAFNAATINSVRSLAPLPGRSIGAGLRMAW